jgi:glycerol-3-phosphate dehydrogenase
VTRDLDRLAARRHDVLIVGGGIYGLTIACDAAARGLSVALVERDDFGSGASFNHLRTIHGGLRYLQHLDLARARESVRERRTLARIAPHAVTPLPFALPLYRSVTRGKLAMRAGVLVDRLVAAGRNHGVPPSLKLPAGHVVSRQAAIERFPGLRRRGLTGAAVWHDYVAPEADRLTFTWAIAAAGHGAVLANHVDATALILDGRRVTGVRATDRLTGRALEIEARITLNAAGGALDRLLEPAGLASGIPMLKAMNLVTTRDAGDVALGGRSASGRHLFLVPWRRRALFGTWESQAAARPDTSPGPDEAEVGRFIAELNEAFPSLDLRRGDVSLVHWGLVPAHQSAGGRVRLERHERIRDHARDGVEGVMSVAGTKYTTARGVAERVTDRLLGKLQQSAVPCRTASSPLPGGHVRDVALTIADARREHDDLVPSDTIPHLVAAYGSRYRDVLELARSNSAWRTRLAEESPVIGAEIIWAVRHEMAETLCDGVVRRTPLGALGYPGEAAAARAADLMGGEKGWSDARREDELRSLRAFYGTSNA